MLFLYVFFRSKHTISEYCYCQVDAFDDVGGKCSLMKIRYAVFSVSKEIWYFGCTLFKEVVCLKVFLNFKTQNFNYSIQKSLNFEKISVSGRIFVQYRKKNFPVFRGNHEIWKSDTNIYNVIQPTFNQKIKFSQGEIKYIGNYHMFCCQT